MRVKVYRAAGAFFVLLFIALMWPVYPLFGGIRPLVLGMPLSLVYVLICLTLSLATLLALFVWEGRAGDDAREDPRRGA